ncbi:MAG: glyoxylate/hydroxypyruvate reductase A [Rhodobacteraceae bacterium]|nr:glyoxylate/hydroxypyruvate reductase A [Paracoccaceae bacterium]MAY48136.1 glyoxylate/hydroxypyruvate reductase A [Paracoccaceae bacterium]
MALLIDIGHDGWMPEEEVRDAVAAAMPGADIRLRDDLGRASDITMIACSSLRRDLPARLPNLALVQKLGAGVETIVAHPSLPPHVRVARLKPMEPAREIAEWALAYILRDQRQLVDFAAAQSRAEWRPMAPRKTRETRAAVLGLGHIGATTARLLRDLGFIVTGWSTSPKQIDGVTCLHGPDALPALLPDQDYVVAILPSTDGTRHLFDADMLARMKPGAALLNAGRGTLIDEPALLTALDTATPARAILDVTATEPLPADSPLWSHPGVTITPHVSGWHLGDALNDVAENYRRLTCGDPLLHEVDRIRGY